MSYDQRAYRNLTNAADLGSPEYEPISLEQARRFLRVDAVGSPPEHEDDPDIADFIKAAREWAEKTSHRLWARRERIATYAAFPGDVAVPALYNGGWGSAPEPIPVPAGPVESIIDVRYYDAANSLQVMAPADYFLVAAPIPLVCMVEGATWPAAYSRPDAVQVRYIGGPTYAGSPATQEDATAAVPSMIKTAIRMLVQSFYDNAPQDEQAKVERVAGRMIRSYRVHSF